LWRYSRPALTAARDPRSPHTRTKLRPPPPPHYRAGFSSCDQQQPYSSRVYGRLLQAAASSGSSSRVGANASATGRHSTITGAPRSDRFLRAYKRASPRRPAFHQCGWRGPPLATHTYHILFLPHIRVSSLKKTTLDSAAIEDHLRPRPSTRLIGAQQ